jgi:putative heme-binding domain-containing protein
VLKQTVSDADPHVRGWTVQLAAVHKPTIDAIPINLRGLVQDASPVVRRFVASAATRLPVEAGRMTLARELYRRTKDAADDPLLPYLMWYAFEPFPADFPLELAIIGRETRVPLFHVFAARRMAAAGTEPALDGIVNAMGDTTDPAALRDLLDGYLAGLKGQTSPKRSAFWGRAFARLMKSPDEDVRDRALQVGLKFGDGGAQDHFWKVLTDPKLDAARRVAAFDVLLDVKYARLGYDAGLLLADPAVRGAALRGLAAFKDTDVPREVLKVYPSLSAAEKRDAVNTLASRPEFARELLAAVEDKRVPPSDIPAETIRQLRSLNDKALTEKIAAVWGTVRDTPADRKKLIGTWQKKLTAPYQGPQDLAAGRAVFARVCQQCHTLYGVGAKVGPDITGSNRADVNYLLENIFDPSAVVPKEYAATKIDLLDGRSITGIVKEETKTTLTVATANETLTVPVADIDRRTPSPLSMMPDDLTKQATEAEIRALIAYLRHPQQVPILATQENVKEFFNGKDLTGWDGDKEVWSVENGEIVGKTKDGLKRNDFLKSQMQVADFKLTVKVKLVPNTENSGIQFRSEPLPDGEMRGPQADMGAGWWGKLYEESGRGLLWKESGEKHVKPGDWNEYVIEAKGSKVRTWLNGQLCVDLDDPKLARRGVIAFQIHSGGPMEVRFKDLKLEVLK